MVGLTMGYPAENPPPRPRYPLDFVLFEDQYPDFSKDQIREAMREMDDGYRAQDYYKNLKAMIPTQGGRQSREARHRLCRRGDRASRRPRTHGRG